MVANRTSRLADAVLEAAPDAIIGVHPDGHILLMNAQAELLFGYPRDELIGELVETLVPDVIPAGRRGTPDGYFADPSAWPTTAGQELAGRRKDGTEFPAEVSMSAIHTDEGVVVTAAVRDVTDRKRAEATFRWMIEVAPDAILGVDASGSIELVNAQCERLFGYRRDDLMGRPVEILIPSGLRPVDAGQIGAGLEMAALHKDGTEIPVEVSLSALETPGGRLTMAAVRDITDRRKFERQLGEQNLALERAGQAKDNFLATMSHEIRTPMNGVIGLSALLLDTELGPMQRRYAAGVHSAGTALLGVINDILDFSKFEAGKLLLDVNNIDLSAILTEVATLVDPTARDNVLVVTRRGSMLPAVVLGDGGRLRQVLLNLVGNAVKFTPRGSVTLRADRAADLPGDPETVTVRFEVTDTGIGIAADDAERLFEPFTQADVSTTRTYGGTGLGLAICRQLTEAMGGTIGVDSEPGQGSTFWCLIPFGQAHAVDRTTQPLATTDVVGLRLLVVDTGHSRAVLQESLRSWKMSSVAADDAIDALGALRQAADRGRPFDVIIIDAECAEVDSAGLANQIVGDPQVAAVHIIVLNHEGPSALTDGTRGVSYLAKPVHQSQLYDCLTKTLAAPPVTAPSAEITPPRPGNVEARSPGQLAGRRILLVEDNHINQIVAVGTLTSLGYVSDVANNGLEAIALTAAHTYDAVLMDCRMPGMDGFTATAEIRNTEGAGQHTPIIAMTASARVADRVRCLAAGMDDYIAKPVNVTDLGAILDRWINADPPGEAPSRPDAASPATVDRPDGDPIGRRLNELAGNHTEREQEMINRLITAFLRRIPDRLAGLGHAITDADALGLEEQAHSLKGAAANIGAVRAAEICQRLETLGGTGHLDATAIDDLNRLQLEITEVETRLDGILQLVSI